MECLSCGVVNAPGRRYCRECGARLGQPCPACHFFNAGEDKYCGGCGGRLKTGGGPLAAAVPVPAFAAGVSGEAALSSIGSRIPPVSPVEIGSGGEGVLQSEIDGLFENILDEEPEVPGEGIA